MKAVAASSDLPAIRSSALARALSDPKVEGLARSLNLNLRDPATLNNLLSRAKETIEASTQVTLGADPVPTGEPPAMDVVPVQNSYVRAALQAYRAIDSMR